MSSLLAIVLTAVVLWFAWRAWRESARSSAARLQLLSEASEVLDEVVETRLPSGYVKVAGTYRGLPVVLEPVIDTLNVRKLPVLWLMVTIPTPLPITSTFDLMMRASGLEVFSRYHQLTYAIDVPQGFPEWSGVRTDDPQGLPSAEVIGRYLQRFHDGVGKELLVTPKGLRMVVLVDQADRGGYLVFRDARFGVGRIEPGVVTSILDDLIALKADLEASRNEGSA